MKGGYTALFTVVLAYAAYQGTAPSKPPSSRPDTRSSPDTLEHFPTIANGVCTLNLNGTNSKPCGRCNALCPAQDLTELIEDFFRAETAGQPDNFVTPWGIPKHQQPNIQFVIASLPDPVHTHMALLFDRGIEAIESAAQASGFLFSRAWMPWDISTHNESTDFTVRAAQEDYRQRMETLPGLMIFRKSVEEKDQAAGEKGQSTGEKTLKDRAILFVFVVGETPTGGLHVEQFQNALKIRRSLLFGADAINSDTMLRIYGPAFSGSLGSLAAILNSPANDKFSKIIIRSGSVSSNRAVEDFCASTRIQPSNDQSTRDISTKTPGPAKSKPDFATFQFSDTYQEYYLGRYFLAQSRHNLHSHIAVLSEDETAFGNQEKRKQQNEDECHQAASPDFPFVRLYFPREIAQLRDAYQQNLKTQAQPANSNATAQPQSGLSLSLGVTGNDDDSVATYSPLQTPLSQESIMHAIVAALRKEHAKIVVIRAADPLDVIFLARYLRLNYPQARLVTVGADLLSINAFVDPRFHGILAVTSYPLLTGMEFPFLKDTPSNKPSPSRKIEHDVHRLFPDSYSVGNFNAFQSLLAEKPSDSAPNLPSADYTQFGLPAFLHSEQCSSAPCSIVAGSDPKQWTAHLWLTAIGRDGYWPVTILDDPPENPAVPSPTVRTVNVDATNKELSFTPYSVHLSVGWTIFWTLSFSLTVLLATLLMRRPAHISRSEILGRFAGIPSNEGNYLLFSAIMLLLIAQIILVFPATFWLGRFAKFDEGATWLASVGEVWNGLWLLTFGYLFSISILGVASWIGFRARNATWLALMGAAVCSLAVLAALFWTVHMWSRKIDTTTGTFLYRYLQIGSGVSPCLPLLFLVGAWIWWCWESLSGVISTKEKHMVLPRMSDFDMEVPAQADAPARKLEPTGPVQLKALLFLVGVWMAWCWKSLSSGASTAGKRTVPKHPPDFAADVPSEANVSPRKLGAADRVRLKALAVAEGQWPWKILGSLPLDRKTLAGAFAGFALIYLLMRPSEIAEAFESLAYKSIYWILLYSCLLLVCYLATQIVSLWLEFRKQLRAIENAPFRRGFSDLRNLTWKPLWKLAGSGQEKFSELLVGEVDALNKILNGPATNERLKSAILNANRSTNLLSEAYEPLIDPTCRPSRDLQKRFFDFQNQLAICATEALFYANGKWKGECAVPVSKGQSDYKDNDKDKQATPESPAADPATRAVEYFLCLFYLNVILIPLRRLQTLILAIAGVFVFVLISYSSYPFESRESFHALLISVFFAISLIVAVVYGQMYSNPLLSRITNTKPGELGLDFWVRLGTFVFIPLLSLLSVQFPELNNFLFSWLQPALQSIK